MVFIALLLVGYIWKNCDLKTETVQLAGAVTLVSASWGAMGSPLGGDSALLNGITSGYGSQLVVGINLGRWKYRGF